MKKIYSILVLSILLFNWFGYRLMISVLEGRANDQLERALDNDAYDESELISIKIPVSYLPYYNTSQKFERVNGQVEIQGVEYKYVKRRIFNDSLELLCIANPAVMKLKAANNEFFRFLNDLQQNGQEKTGHSRHGISKNFSFDYYTVLNTYRFQDMGRVLPPLHAHYYLRFTTRCQNIIEQPPENT